MGRLSEQAMRKKNQAARNFGRPLPFPHLDSVASSDQDDGARLVKFSDRGPLDLNISGIVHCDVLDEYPGQPVNVGGIAPAMDADAPDKAHCAVVAPERPTLTDAEIQTETGGLIGPLYDACWHLFQTTLGKQTRTMHASLLQVPQPAFVESPYQSQDTVGAGQTTSVTDENAPVCSIPYLPPKIMFKALASFSCTPLEPP